MAALLLGPGAGSSQAGDRPHPHASSFETIPGVGGAPVRLHVYEVGSGRPLVLLHGIGGSAYSFRHMIPALARSNRVIAIDLKGFGLSDKPLDHAYGTADHAALVAAVLRRRGLTDVTLLGHSFGGTVALHLALTMGRQEPGRIRRPILMDAPAYPQPLALTQRLLTLPVLPYVALTAVPPILATRSALDTTPRLMPRRTDEEAIAYAEPLYDAGGRHALIATTRQLAEGVQAGIEPPVHLIRQPTLMIWCRHDRTVPVSTGERLARELPRARLALIEGCAHTPNEEAPREALRLILPFLAR